MLRGQKLCNQKNSELKRAILLPLGEWKRRANEDWTDVRSRHVWKDADASCRLRLRIRGLVEIWFVGRFGFARRARIWSWQDWKKRRRMFGSLGGKRIAELSLALAWALRRIRSRIESSLPYWVEASASAISSISSHMKSIISCWRRTCSWVLW